MSTNKHLDMYIREALDISQSAVAYVLNMSQPAYSKIERGETEVKALQLYKIATCMGITVYELLPEAMASDVMAITYWHHWYTTSANGGIRRS